MSSSSEVERIETFVVEIPLPAPIPHAFLGARTQLANLVVFIHTRDGCKGFGYVFAENTAQMQAVRQIVEHLAESIIGKDALRREFLFEHMRKLTVELLPEGAATLAISALDIALWDICARQAGLPLWKMLGGFRDTVRTYTSEALWRHSTAAELENDAGRLVSKGFTGVKLRIGGRPIAEDVERARIVRQAIGPDVALMTDALWSYTPSDAIKLARAMNDAGVDLAWLEEPVREGDFAGLTRLRNAEILPIAAGERVSSLHAINNLVPAIDHAILDVNHIGGITPWIKAAAILEAANLPISAHAAPEIQAHLLAAYRTGAWIEHFSWWDVLFEEPLQPTNGTLLLGSRSGLGLTVSQEALTRFAAK